MGIIMDSASNVIVELEPDGTGIKAGLMVNDLVTVVDGVVVTVIEDGMIWRVGTARRQVSMPEQC